MTLNAIQRYACERVLKTAEEERRDRGLKIARRGHLLILKPSDNGNILAELTYEKFFDLRSRQLREVTHRLAVMVDGTAACDCPDSIHRREVCQHAVALSTILLQSNQEI